MEVKPIKPHKYLQFSVRETYNIKRGLNNFIYRPYYIYSQTQKIIGATERRTYMINKTEYGFDNHSYNEKIAMSIINETKDVFTSMFLELKNTVEKDWL